MLDLSVLVTCFNKEKYLDECIQSIVRQSKEPKEIIVVHDGCEEPMHHVKVTSIFLKSNKGVAKARHEAFRFSTGKLILFVDGDDVISPDYLEKMCLVLHAGADVAYPDIFHWSDRNARIVITPEQITPQFVQDYNKVVIPVTSLMDRSVYEKLKGFREWPVLEDLDFWIRALCNGYTLKKAQTLLWYRHLPDNRNSGEIGEKKEVMKEILAQFKFTKDKIEYVKD